MPDGITSNTKVLQQLIDCMRLSGGGLFFPPGRYLTGGLSLCSNLHLDIGAGAVLLGSPDLTDYSHLAPSPAAFPEGYEGVRALISAVDSENITISGEGAIDGQGALFEKYPEVRGGRPRNLWFARCNRVRIQGLHLRNSGFWMQHYINCTDLKLVGLDVWNHAGPNNDGLDIDSCRDVLIENCRIDSSDDAICLKTGNEAPTENVIVSNCFTRTHCNHFKIGSETRGHFKNILVDGLIMTPSYHLESHPTTVGADWRGACGIALSAVDGGGLENITVQNISMDHVRVPFFVHLGDRGRNADFTFHDGGPGIANRICLKNINARQASGQASYICGLYDAPVCEVLIEDCTIEIEDAVSEGPTLFEIPEIRGARPSMETFGRLPAGCLFIRHVDGLSIRDLTIRQPKSDLRPHVLWVSCQEIQVKNLICRSK